MIDDSTNLMHLNLQAMNLQSRISHVMWSIYRSRSLQGVHLSDNEIPDTHLRTLLFVFGIPQANEGDLLD